MTDVVLPFRLRQRKTIVRLSLLYLAITSLFTLWFYFSADQWWSSTIVLFGPRIFLLLPVLVWLLVCLWSRSKWAIGPTILTLLITLGPLLGGTVSLGLSSTGSTSSPRLRIVTHNLGGTRLHPDVMQAYLLETRPDILLLQEATPTMTPEEFPSGWNVVDGCHGQRVVSRFPLQKEDLFDAPSEAPGGLTRYRVSTPYGLLRLINVHLPTPRPGIENAIGSKFRHVQSLREVIAARDRVSQMAKQWVGEVKTDLILAGDFNMPVESAIYQRDWGRWTNAFSQAGTGWGWTKQTRWYGVRIDHVLYASTWRCEQVSTGPNLGSDHQSLIVELVLSEQGS